jgi:UDP-2,3-diacylglucosamine hydrolase
MAHKWSRHNRLAHEDNPWQWRGEDERIVKFANEFQKEHGGSVDYFIFGHFHYRTQMELREGGQMYLLGEWVNGSDYLMFDGQELHSLNME